MQNAEQMLFYPNDSILEETMVVYQIKNLVTGDCYVGHTTRKLLRRYEQHIGCHCEKRTSNAYNRSSFYDDFRKQDPSDFQLSILFKGETKAQIEEVEKLHYKLPQYKKYAKRFIEKDTRRKSKFKRVCTIDKDGGKKFYESPIALSREFKMHRSNVIKAIRGQYKFKRKYIVKYVSDEIFEAESQTQTQLKFNFL